MAKASPQSAPPASTSSAAPSVDRVESLARELFIKFAQPVTNRTPQWLAVEAYKLAKGFYEVADLSDPTALFETSEEPEQSEEQAAELQEASA